MNDEVFYHEIANAIPELHLKIVQNENNREAFKQLLSSKINELINTDFLKMVNILYRLDISEDKLKNILKDSQTQPAAFVIAELIINRQSEKEVSRKMCKQDSNIPDEEKW